MRADAHHHLWNMDLDLWSWITPSSGVLYKTYEPADLEPLVRANGIDKTVVVQANNTYEDTEYMLRHAAEQDWIGAVVGWVRLTDASEAADALDRFCEHAKFRGMRHLTQMETEEHWLLRPDVLKGLRELASRDLVLQVPAEFPRVLDDIPGLAEALPNLTIVIDHLAQIPLHAFEPWAEQMAAAAQAPNVVAKVSGLGTASKKPDWSHRDTKPFVDHAFEVFGGSRLMYGSDWPVSLLAGPYEKMLSETELAVAGRPQAELDELFGGTAARVYRLS